jgi:hypothetical protein
MGDELYGDEIAVEVGLLRIMAKSRVTCHTRLASRSTGRTTIFPGSQPSSSGMPLFRRATITGASSNRRSSVVSAGLSRFVGVSVS